MQTDNNKSLTFEVNANDENSTSLILTLDNINEENLQKVTEIFSSESKSNNLLVAIPIMVDEFASLGVSTTVGMKSESWFTKLIFKVGLKIASWEFSKFGRDKFIRMHCS